MLDINTLAFSLNVKKGNVCDKVIEKIISNCSEYLSGHLIQTINSKKMASARYTPSSFYAVFYELIWSYPLIQNMAKWAIRLQIIKGREVDLMTHTYCHKHGVVLKNKLSCLLKMHNQGNCEPHPILIHKGIVWTLIQQFWEKEKCWLFYMFLLNFY